MQEVLRFDFEESEIVGKISLWGGKNSNKLPDANQPFSGYQLLMSNSLFIDYNIFMQLSLLYR